NQRGPTRNPVRLPGGGIRRHARCGREHVLGGLRRFRPRLSDRGPRRHPRAARSLHGQTLHPVLHHQTRRRRCAELRSHQADEIRNELTLGIVFSSPARGGGGPRQRWRGAFTHTPSASASLRLLPRSRGRKFSERKTMPLQLITPPAIEPVTLEEAKAHLK